MSCKLVIQMYAQKYHHQPDAGEDLRSPVTQVFQSMCWFANILELPPPTGTVAQSSIGADCWTFPPLNSRSCTSSPHPERLMFRRH
jgi:hypothetical protein